jgi:hypothetical protein
MRIQASVDYKIITFKRLQSEPHSTVRVLQITIARHTYTIGNNILYRTNH